MNSPMVKRRAHIRNSASGSSSNSLATQKRVSFYSNDSDILENSDLPEDRGKSHTTLQRYKSEWILGGEETFTEKSERKKTTSRHLRRFQSELQLNRADSHSYSLCGMERGAPEGQEDPDIFQSLRNLSILKTAEELGKKSQNKWNNSTLTKYAFTLLNSMKSSLEARKPAFNEETKRKTFQKAREMISWDGPSLPWPEMEISDIPINLTKEIESELLHVKESRNTNKSKLCQIVVDTLGLGSVEDYKLFEGYLDFYSGKPRRANILLGRKALYVTLGTSHSLLWSAALFDIISVRVKSSYSELCVKSVVSSVTINFLDSNISRQCGSYLDLYLNTLRSDLTNQCIVSAETPEELRKRWKPWLATQINDECADLQYVGPVFWEEVVLTSIIIDDKCVFGPYKCGHLMLAWNKSRSWQPGYFMIKAGVLYQFATAQDKVPVFILPLSADHCKGYGRNFLSSRPHSIEIQITKGKCLLLAAASESEAADWLSTISYSSSVWEESSDCAESSDVSACGVAISADSLLIFQTENGTPRRRTSSAIGAISFVGVSSDETDIFCTVEFACREASEGEGDWVFYFASAAELLQFVSTLNCQSQVLSQEIIPSLRRRYTAVFSE